MRSTRFLWPLLLLLPLLGGTAAEVDRDGWVSLRRGPCFGNCPIYRVTLRADGTATYVGGDYAPRAGPFEGEVDPAAVHAILAELERVRFWRMRRDLQLRIMDYPDAEITAERRQRWHRVHVNLPPEELGPILAEIDSIADRIEWRPARERRPEAVALAR